MVRFLALLLVLALNAAAYADHTLIITKSGYWIVVVDDAGIPGLHKIDHVMDYTKEPIPNPTPTPAPVPTPTPSPLTDRAKAIKTAAEKVAGDPGRDTTAKGLAELYRQVATLARTPGAVTNSTTLKDGLRKGTDIFLDTRGVKAQWQPVRDEVGVYFTVLDAKQPAASLGDYAALLDEAASGLDASAPNRQIDPEMLKFIIQLIIQIIALFKQP